MNREAIYSALFNLVGATAGIVTASRRLKIWTEVPQGDQPALFMTQLPEVPETQTNQPTKWHLHVDLHLYAQTQDSKQSPSTIINPIVDAICNLVMPPNLEKQTLGGLVEYCRISGQIQTDEGVLGEQAVVIIPIEILVV